MADRTRFQKKLSRMQAGGVSVAGAWMAALVLGAVMAAAIATGARAASVHVNASPLDQSLVAAYRIPPGRYWYDRLSGLWGREGGPAAGKIAHGLHIGGPLRADASRGTTGVFVNGRELTRLETNYLSRRLGNVPRGRYWLDANLHGGVQGGPTSFYLGAAAGGGSNHSGPFGSIMSDGACTFVHLPGGSSVGAGAC